MSDGAGSVKPSGDKKTKKRKLVDFFKSTEVLSAISSSLLGVGITIIRTSNFKNKKCEITLYIVLYLVTLVFQVFLIGRSLVHRKRLEQLEAENEYFKILSRTQYALAEVISKDSITACHTFDNSIQHALSDLLRTKSPDIMDDVAILYYVYDSKNDMVRRPKPVYYPFKALRPSNIEKYMKADDDIKDKHYYKAITDRTGKQYFILKDNQSIRKAFSKRCDPTTLDDYTQYIAIKITSVDFTMLIEIISFMGKQLSQDLELLCKETGVALQPYIVAMTKHYKIERNRRRGA